MCGWFHSIPRRKVTWLEWAVRRRDGCVCVCVCVWLARSFRITTYTTIRLEILHEIHEHKFFQLVFHKLLFYVEKLIIECWKWSWRILLSKLLVLRYFSNFLKYSFMLSYVIEQGLTSNVCVASSVVTNHQVNWGPSCSIHRTNECSHGVQSHYDTELCHWFTVDV